MGSDRLVRVLHRLRSEAVAAMSHAEYEQHVAELREQAEYWKAREVDNGQAAYFASFLLFYMDELDRERDAHATTLSHWAQSIEKTFA